MAKRKNYRKTKAYSRSPKKRGVKTDAVTLEHQSNDTSEAKAKPKVVLSASDSKSLSNRTYPSNIVLVRYSKGKDHLQAIDKISLKEIILIPGDTRPVHMDKSLVAQLESLGFEFEIM